MAASPRTGIASGLPVGLCLVLAPNQGARDTCVAMRKSGRRFFAGKRQSEASEVAIYEVAVSEGLPRPLLHQMGHGAPADRRSPEALGLATLAASRKGPPPPEKSAALEMWPSRPFGAPDGRRAPSRLVPGGPRPPCVPRQPAAGLDVGCVFSPAIGGGTAKRRPKRWRPPAGRRAARRGRDRRKHRQARPAPPLSLPQCSNIPFMEAGQKVPGSSLAGARAIGKRSALPTRTACICISNNRVVFLYTICVYILMSCILT